MTTGWIPAVIGLLVTLAHNDVNRIVKDSHGFRWFCTADGLSRFDGYTFTNFGPDQGLPQSSVNDLLETRAGEYWVATNDGLVFFDPKGRPGRRAVDEKTAATPAPMFVVVSQLMIRTGVPEPPQCCVKALRRHVLLRPASNQSINAAHETMRR